MRRRHTARMKTKFSGHLYIAATSVALLASAAVSGAPRLAPVPEIPAGAKKLTAHVAGRVTSDGAYQWPGLYFEASFKGRSVYFTSGPGNVILEVRVDGQSV